MPVRNKLLMMLSAALFTGGVLAGCSDDDDDLQAATTTGAGGAGGEGGGATTLNVYEVATTMPQYSSLVAAVDKAGLAPALQDESATLTVFAPDDDAFQALLTSLGATSLDDVTAEQLRPILLYHVLGVELDAAGVTSAAEANEKIAGLGGSIQFGLANSSAQLDETAIVDMPDVDASNGIIHGIDAVILPSITDVVVSDPSFSSLEAALMTADMDPSDPQLLTALDDDDATYTLFAPPDTAFDNLLTTLSDDPSTGITALGDFQSYQLIPVLKYHVVAGMAVRSTDVMAGEITTLGGDVTADTAMDVTIDGALIVVPNLITSNGVIQVVDSVLVPSITDVVTTAPEFSALGSAITAADADAATTPKIAPALDVMPATGAYTLFAPNNASFMALGDAAPTGQALTNVLLYHVLNEATPIYAANALALDTPTAFPTLLGSGVATLLTVSSMDADTVVLDDTGSNVDGEVTRANYFTSNGVLHMINKVLLPQ